MACPANRTFLEFNLEALSPPAEQSLFPILGAGRTRHIESQTALGLTLSYRTAASLTAQERLQAISDLKHWPHGTFPWIRRSIITALENPGQAVRYGLICKEDFLAVDPFLFIRKWAGTGLCQDYGACCA